MDSIPIQNRFTVLEIEEKTQANVKGGQQRSPEMRKKIGNPGVLVIGNSQVQYLDWHFCEWK